ncbi:MAG: hypothetical protein OEU32_10900 [Acidimicrobiia bacterium]|nr:hypothetical protein [Acidimicrobiia bacterium]
MGNGSKKPAPLPKGAPKGLKDFVSCKAATVEVDSTKLDWIPEGPFGEFGPTIAIEPGTAPNRATIRYGVLELPASIGPDGQLVVDTSSVPGAGPLNFLEDAIQEWVKAFNDTMKANKKKLDGIEVKGTKVTLTKGPVVAAPTETSVTPPPTGTIELPQTPGDSGEAAEDKSSKKGCRELLFGILILVVIAVIIGVVLLSRDDGDDPTTTDVATDEPPLDEPVLKVAPEPEAEIVGETEEPPVVEESTEAEASPEVEESPEVVEPPRQVAATFFPIDPLETGEAFDVPAVERLGPFTLEPPVTVDFFLREEPAGNAYPYFVLVTPVAGGAFEGWVFDDETSEQTGNTTFFPESQVFDTFGAGPGQGIGIPCAGGYLVFGELTGADPRTLSSWGITLYVELGPDDGFPDGTTGTAGAFIAGGPSTPTLFDVEPAAGTIRADTWETSGSVDECVNDPEINEAILDTVFFSTAE